MLSISRAISPTYFIEVESGEENKTLMTCQHIWQELTNAGFDRKAAVLDLGGGVIGDMGDSVLLHTREESISGECQLLCYLRWMHL